MADASKPGCSDCAAPASAPGSSEACEYAELEHEYESVRAAHDKAVAEKGDVSRDTQQQHGSDGAGASASGGPAVPGEAGSEPVSEQLSEEELKDHLEQAKRLKQQGNDFYTDDSVDDALKCYMEALALVPPTHADAAVYHGNISACHFKAKEYAKCVDSCTSALEIDPKYQKVLLRRADAYEMMGDSPSLSKALKVAYSPTGREFATGSYDRTVRIFNVNEGHSHEVYHTKRMQKIFSVTYTGDAKYILSGSDDTNIRVWKANASAKLGVVPPRERAKLRYSRALQDRYKHVGEVKRITRYRHVPKPIRHATKVRHEMAQSQRRKERNRRAHSRPGTVPIEAEREKHGVMEVE